MRLLTWNIRQGGSRRLRERLARVLDSHEPDVAVLCEYQAKHADAVRACLMRAGLSHALGSTEGPRVNGLLIASRHPLEAVAPDPEAPPLPERWLTVRLPERSIFLTALHVPNFADKRKRTDPERWDKERFWRAIVAFARRHADRPHAILGDWNTGTNDLDTQGMRFHLDRYVEQLRGLGWVDAWRSLHPGERDYTWFSHVGNGFRLDHAYLSPPLGPRLAGAYHSHAERLEGLSDHALLVVDLDL